MRPPSLGLGIKERILSVGAPPDEDFPAETWVKVYAFFLCLFITKLG